MTEVNDPSLWWKQAVVYQVYPRSFKDSRGEGLGQIAGVTEKIGYLKELGVDAIWLSPFYPSQLADGGYDVDDYLNVDPKLGTMDDFDALAKAAHADGIKIVVDIVPNHSSNLHEWFKAALAAKPGSPERDRYIFRDGKGPNGDEPPTNWQNHFGGPAWTRVPDGQWYLHMFTKEQPDWNWENKEVRDKIYKMINWWLDKGLGGFRIDAIINIKKDTSFPSYEPDGDDGLVSCVKMVEETDGVGEFLEEMKHETFEKYDAFTVGEVFNMKEDELREFVGDDGHFSSMFDFSALELTYGEHGWYDSKPVDFKRWREVLFASQKEMEGIGFKANIIENHDEPRGASRYLPEYAQNEMGKKMLATTSILLRGIPFIYQGQEIGMTNCHRNDISEYDDISTKDQYQVAIDAGCTKEEALACCYENSRDNARTPMQWSADENGGFSTHAPWLAVNPNYKEINVSEQEGRADSVLSYYKELITLRKSPEYEETFVYGNVEPVYEDTDTVFGFMRMGKENRQKILVAANYGKEAVSLPLPGTAKKLLLSNAGRRKLADADHITLESLETAVVLLKA